MLQFLCEPLRSFEEGLCPFAPSEESTARDEHIFHLDDELSGVKLRLDR